MSENDTDTTDHAGTDTMDETCDKTGDDTVRSSAGMATGDQTDQSTLATEPRSPRAALLTHFRAHATARLRNDTAEALRLAFKIGDDQRMHHLLFLFALFTEVVVKELGDRPDPGDLAELTKQLHDKHFRPAGTFNALRAEAMIRAACGEAVLLTEIPHSDQFGYMWAVMGELVDPDVNDGALDELFELAEQTCADLVGEALASPMFTPPETPPTSSSRSGTTDTADTGLEGTNA